MNFTERKFIIRELYKIADSIDLEQLSIICNQETIDKMNLFKKMINKLKNYDTERNS